MVGLMVGLLVGMLEGTLVVGLAKLFRLINTGVQFCAPIGLIALPLEGKD